MPRLVRRCKARRLSGLTVKVKSKSADSQGLQCKASLPDKFELENKHIVINGCSRGIGEEVSLWLRRRLC